MFAVSQDREPGIGVKSPLNVDIGRLSYQPLVCVAIEFANERMTATAQM